MNERANERLPTSFYFLIARSLCGNYELCQIDFFFFSLTYSRSFAHIQFNDDDPRFDLSSSSPQPPEMSINLKMLTLHGRRTDPTVFVSFPQLKIKASAAPQLKILNVLAQAYCLINIFKSDSFQLRATSLTAWLTN